MLTLLIQLKNASETSWYETCTMVTENFPGGAVLSNDDPLEGLRLNLNQAVLTDMQRDWLHLSAIATKYIDEYQVISLEQLAKENERLTKEYANMRNALKDIASELREITDNHNMSTTLEGQLLMMASGIEGMFKKEAGK